MSAITEDVFRVEDISSPQVSPDLEAQNQLHPQDVPATPTPAKPDDGVQEPVPARPPAQKTNTSTSTPGSFRSHVGRVSTMLRPRSRTTEDASAVSVSHSTASTSPSPHPNPHHEDRPPPHKLILRYLLPIRKKAALWLFPHLQPHPRSFTVIVLDNGTVYKRTHPNELATLRFLAVHLPSVPIPKVYDAWVVEDNKETVTPKERDKRGEKLNRYVEIIMERVQGVPLGLAWFGMSDAQKKNVTMHLKIIMDELRDLEQKTVFLPPEGKTSRTTSTSALDVVPKIHVMGERPTGHDVETANDFAFGGIGSISGGPCVDTRVTSEGSFGPFEDEHAMNDYLVGRLSNMSPSVRLGDIRERMRNNHSIILTHGELVPRNIIVYHGRVSAIVDWDQAGWRPEYWEWMKSMYDYWDAEWPKIAKEVMQPYEDELSLDLELREIEDFPAK